MENILRRRPLGTDTARQIANLVDARQARVASGQTLVEPSTYWADFIDNFAYVFELSPSSLTHIRQHTYHLTSDGYLRYYLGGNDDATRLVAKYDALCEATRIRGLAEPATGIGFRHTDGLVSWDALRYLSVIADLLQAGVLDQHTAVDILEIGGGYGGLCRMACTLNPHARYSILDLEETLFFSKTYLTQSLPGYDVRLVRRPSDIEAGPRRVHLIPQHLAEELEIGFDLAINHQSMQEMQVAQIDRYLRLIPRYCARFYSRNMKRHDVRIALQKGLSIDIQSQILERFPRLVWRDGSAAADTLLDDHLPRFVVNSAAARETTEPVGAFVPSGLSFDPAIVEQAIHRGDMLAAQPLDLGVTFRLTLHVPADLIVLSFVTWLTKVTRLTLGLVARDATGQVLHRSTAVAFDFTDWQEISFDLRSVRECPRVTLEISVLGLEGEGTLGVPVYEPSEPLVCSLELPSAPAGVVPAGRLVSAR